MKSKSKFLMSYRSMLILALITGGVGIVFLFFKDFELLTFMLTVAVLGSLIGGANSYTEQERRQLELSYKTAFEWLFMFMLFAFALVEISKFVVLLNGVAAFLNYSWTGMLLSVMCILMGLAGLKRNGGTESG